MFVVYSTYLTRSGVLSDTSVHSFASGSSAQILVFLFFFYWISGMLLLKNTVTKLIFTLIGLVLVFINNTTDAVFVANVIGAILLIALFIVDYVLFFDKGKKEEELMLFIEENLNDICASIQYTIIEILMDKLKLAVKETGIKQIAIGGGVSANSGIRRTLKEAEQKYGWKTFVPKFEYTTDNAAMIGIVGYQKFLSQHFENASVVSKARIQF